MIETFKQKVLTASVDRYVLQMKFSALSLVVALTLYPKTDKNHTYLEYLLLTHC